MIGKAHNSADILPKCERCGSRNPARRPRNPGVLGVRPANHKMPAESSRSDAGICPIRSKEREQTGRFLFGNGKSGWNFLVNDVGFDLRRFSRTAGYRRSAGTRPVHRPWPAAAVGRCRIRFLLSVPAAVQQIHTEYPGAVCGTRTRTADPAGANWRGISAGPPAAVLASSGKTVPEQAVAHAVPVHHRPDR